MQYFTACSPQLLYFVLWLKLWFLQWESLINTRVLQFMSLDGVGNWKAGNSVGDSSAKGDNNISLGLQTAIKQAIFKGIFNGIFF
jgi:hypothetical protein